jgi:hypothetical protein
MTGVGLRTERIQKQIIVKPFANGEHTEQKRKHHEEGSKHVVAREVAGRNLASQYLVNNDSIAEAKMFDSITILWIFTALI